MKWKLLVEPEDAAAAQKVVRLNGLGSLFYFEKVILKRDRLTNHLHKRICDSLEVERPRFVLELPRDHMKTTMVSEGYLMWRALPFTETDEILMRELGYDDSWIKWMNHIHNPNIRTLTVSESIGNAIMIGKRIDSHYENNGIFRSVFPEIIPTPQCVWNNESKSQRRPKLHAHGEGTFDYIGVGGATQSRHYDLIDEDDIVGRDAMNSEVVMNDTIEYHKLLAGVFDGVGHELIVNNRWAVNDVSGYVRENEKSFIIESHSALGGCCAQHPHGEPIFPEEFSIDRLEEIRDRLGPVLFSHQFLNLPVAAEDCIFKPDWLKFYAPSPSPVNPARHWIHHEVSNGETLKDIDPKMLHITMVVDPNHAGDKGRCHHAVVVTGLDPETDRVYLLDLWAKSASYDELLANTYALALRWNLREFWLETVAAQRYLKYHIEYRNKIEKRQLKVNELKTDRSENGKRVRIESLVPIFQNSRFWCRKDQSAFLDEYYSYPGGRTVDVLDCLGYSPQTWNAIYARNVLALLAGRQEKFRSRRSVTGY